MAAESQEDLMAWRQTFQELVQEVKPLHTWTLTEDRGLVPGELRPGWRQYQQWTFARFQCSSCSRRWASAHVLVLFHVHWRAKKHKGRVKMRAFSQRCQRCTQAAFETPEFTLENVTRTLNNLVLWILKKCYHEGFKQVDAVPSVKDTSLEGPHDSLNCEACLQSFCAQSGSSLALQSPAPTCPSTPSKDTGKPKATAACTSPSVPRADKPLMSTVNPAVLTAPKDGPKVSHTSEPSTEPRLLTKQVPPSSTASPKAPEPPRATLQIGHACKSPTAARIPSQQLVHTLVMSSRVSKPPEADPHVSHTSELSTASRFQTKEGPPTASLTTWWATPTLPPTYSAAAGAATRAEAGRVSPSSRSLSRSFPEPRWHPASPASYTESRIQMPPFRDAPCPPASWNCPVSCQGHCCGWVILLIVITVVIITVQSII